MAIEFVVDGVDLTRAQRTELAQAVAAAGSLALNRTIAEDLGTFEVNGLNLRKWPLIGRYVLFGRDQTLRGRRPGLPYVRSA